MSDSMDPAEHNQQCGHSQQELDAIAESFSAAIRRGENPSIEDTIAKHGDSTGQLRSLLESIAMIEGLKSSAIQSSSPTSSTFANLAQIDHLDDYKIIRQIGRGGMGVVFEAIHQPLSRRVALKVLATRAFEQSRDLQRFQREATAAARLRHTNIVPVFGVGQDCGFHYYVMDYIDGNSLREWLQQRTGQPEFDFPTVDEGLDQTAGEIDFANAHSTVAKGTGHPSSLGWQSPNHMRWVAQTATSICDALQYAHEQGILHRDIKPANLLIDTEHRVWIADFGLAKVNEAKEVTGTGDLLGTPQYMSPESLGGIYDVRSEVYGVGLTIFEMLTGQTAIQGRTTAEVIRNAGSGVNTSPRKFNPQIPRDLETIVQKSLATEPAKRYSTAGELCDDLTRFLNGHPIAARRVGPTERLIRWSRREPAAASMTFSTFLLLIALATVSAIGYWRTSESLAMASAAESKARTSLKERTTALEQAESQRVRAEANLQVALKAFDQIMHNVTDRGIHADADFAGDATDRIIPNVTPADARMLQSLLGFFDELAANNSEDLLAESALAARRAGDVYAYLGKLREADRAYTDAMERYRQVAVTRPDDLDPILAQAEIMNELAAILSLRGQINRAMQMFSKTVTQLETSDNVLDSSEGAFQYARAHRLYASLSVRIGLDDSLNLPERNTFRFKRSPIGTMLRMRNEDELAAANEAIQTLEKLISKSPNNSKLLAELARAFRTKSKVAGRANQPRNSEFAMRRSIELFEQLLQENPRSDDARYELAMTLSSAEAFGWNPLRRARRANELSMLLMQHDPNQTRYRALRARSLERLAQHQKQNQSLHDAEQNLSEAIDHYEKLRTLVPELRVYRNYQAAALESMADIKMQLDDKANAKVNLERALALVRPATASQKMTPLARIQIQRLRKKLEDLSPPQR